MTFIINFIYSIHSHRIREGYMYSIMVNIKRLKRPKIGLYSSTLQVSHNNTNHKYPILVRGYEHLGYSTTISALDNINMTISTITQPSRRKMSFALESSMAHGSGLALVVGRLIGWPNSHFIILGSLSNYCLIFFAYGVLKYIPLR